ncbi:type I polyketide synthase [Winogradskyella sediminis]|uniref:Amino acid adenylation domain-containing protein n=1 Tax=Winogradskyella sediminis TaxID=1382466 RepID=A0A1H1W3U9_9FLAO|nr:type I polyketide synthase [Winogradskyella sediminis]SDS91968.1 amino acid adenylation domain-containing protein [Winogradskyella sediminis]
MDLTKPEIIELLEEFNTTSSEFPHDNTIVEVFVKQAKQTPNHVAVVFDTKEISYKALDAISNQFAKYLIANHHIGLNDFVGLMIERSEWIVISILGILKAGATYVPIDIDSPQVRKDFIKNDSNCKFTVNDSIIQDFIASQSQYDTEALLNIGSSPNDLAYIMYTSGTTGNPKGVMIRHISVVNLITFQTRNYGLDSTDKILQFSNYFFDASIEQIFLALLNGARTIIVDKQTIKDYTILDFIEKHEITHLNSTPSYLETIADLSQIRSLKRIVAGGETCSLKLAQKLSQICDFYNAYGLTETTVTSMLYKYSSDDDYGNLLPIGKTIPNTKAYILSEDLKLLPVGATGDLYLSGNALAKGYLNLPELSSKSFIENPFEPQSVMYRTGDLAKWLPDGNIEFIGRKDDQVKIGGYRLELGEIEAAILTLPNIKRACVIASNYFEEAKLVAYIESEDLEKDSNSIRQQLSDILPAYMIPALIMWVDDFPTTTNGKIDKKNLPNPEFQRPAGAPPLKKPKTDTEKAIAKIWSATLHIPQIGIDDNFFEMGGNSLLTQKVAALIAERLNLKVPVTKMYQFPTISGLAKFLEKDQNKSRFLGEQRKTKRQANSDIAIIGMAGRFPGASTIDELWDVLREGKETISFFTPEELDKSIPESIRNNPLYVGARGIVPSAKTFDAKFFGLNPKLASAMDPQQRLFLEISWEALEQSGYLPNLYDGKIGVFAGVYTNTYFLHNVFPNKELMNQIGEVQANTTNDKDYIATRTAYHLNLKGPAVSVHSACSTSSLAIAQAVESIRNGQCDVALAGGSSVTSPMYSGHLYQEGSMLSANGQCRSFDANGSGTMFCDGAGVVLLKSLEDAERDGDIIHGVIKGIGVNNDGSDKGSFTAPSVEGQAGAINSALLDADVKPSQISYIEAHGTATPLGDPIEIEGLKLAFGDQDAKGYCAVGSIKSNIGHLTAAAGVAGVIKTTLALKHRQIPASLGFEKPNPSIDFENSPFFVNNKLRPWQSEVSRVAGVSSFGVGGTNVHIVVEEYKSKVKDSDSGRPLQLLAWSAKSQNSQEGYKYALSDFIKTNSDVELADIAYSLNATRDVFQNRSFVLAESHIKASATLSSDASKLVKINTLKIIPNELAFLFPGQGSQYLDMGKALYESETVFKAAVDHCAELLQDELKLDIRQIIYPEVQSTEAEFQLKDTKFTQPALFVIEYALSQLWMSWGIKPTLLCGHSIGEFVAAHLAGVFTLEDALHLITVRGKLVSELPGGSMLSARTNIESLENLLPETLSIAAINSDKLIVISGPDVEIEQFSKVLNDRGIANKLLLTSHAFHSSMMDPVLDTFEEEVKKMTLSVPRLPIVSTVTGDWLTDAEATSSQYWTNHLRDTVNFSGAMETVLSLDDPILLEIGPGRALSTLSMQKKGLKSLASISSLSIPKDGETAYHTVLTALGELWLNGIEPHWKSFYEGQERSKVWLPSYVFDRKPCWVDPPIVEGTMNNDINNSTVTSTINTEQNIINEPKTNINTKIMRKPILLKKIADIIEDNSGVEIEANEADQSFLELGLDSLVLTQMAITCKNEFNVPITFRQLNDEFGSPNLLAEHLDSVLPAEAFVPATNDAAPVQQQQQQVPMQQQIPIQQSAPVAQNVQNTYAVSQTGQNPALNLIAQQLQLLGQQLQLLQGGVNNVATPPPPVSNTQSSATTNEVKTASKTVSPLINTNDDIRTEEEKKEHQKPFGASPKIDKQAIGLSHDQSLFLKNLTKRYNTKTAKSKAYAQHHRSKMADPRVVSGFKPLTKELVYPLVIEKSSGNKLWDLDGNEYMDILNGFGACLFGHQPDFIKEALYHQIEQGFEVGPQHPLAGEVCELLCEFTGHDRAALCNTGSEAVLGAMRIARTVTGRSLIVAFSRSYHGINDEVIVRGSKKLRTFPAAPGILPGAVQNMLILDYGTEESLTIIKERAHEIAAVLVEPVQSRRPEFQPIEFLKEVREVTKASDTVLIFDEIITGFRMHPGGAQAIFGIEADVATYGKVIGGGMSIGAICGKRKYMDALDGGFWKFGDDSFPEIGVTYFAGTFVRHPLALAASKGSLIHFKNKGIALQNGLAALTERLATELNSYFKNNSLPMEITYYRSLWRLKFLEDIPYSELFFVLMREKGFHIWDGFPCYMTEAFSEDDIDKLIRNIVISVEELIAVGIFTSELIDHEHNQVNQESYSTKELNTPPVPNARLGIDANGDPAWFVKDEKNEGEFLRIDL